MITAIVSQNLIQLITGWPGASGADCLAGGWGRTASGVMVAIGGSVSRPVVGACIDSAVGVGAGCIGGCCVGWGWTGGASVGAGVGSLAGTWVGSTGTAVGGGGTGVSVGGIGAAVGCGGGRGVAVGGNDGGDD
jgi:hypothetical protein